MRLDPVGIIVVEDGDAARYGRVEALEHIANRPIAHHVIDVLDSAGVSEVLVLSSDALAPEIRACLAAQETRHGAPVRYIEHAAGPLDLARSMRLAANAVDGAPCIIHLASGLLGESLAPFADRLRSDSPDVALFVHQSEAPDERLSASTQDMLHVAELDPDRAALGLAGVWLFGPGALKEVSAATWQHEDNVDLTPVADRISAAGGNLQVLLVDAWRRYAGNPLDLLELNRIALDRLDTDCRRPANNGNLIEGRVRIHEGASVSASVIVGPAVIGAGARIADAYIGPYTSVGAGARIEGTEIERSIISAGASITHVGGRLVASVVGRNARIFRDFSLPRALRLRVGDGTEVALC